MRERYSPISAERLFGALKDEGRIALAQDIANLFPGVTREMAVGYLDSISKANNGDQAALSNLSQSHQTNISPSTEALVYIAQSCAELGLLDLGSRVILATLDSSTLIQSYIHNPFVGNALTYMGDKDSLLYHLNVSAAHKVRNSPSSEKTSIFLCTLPKAGSFYLAQNIQHEFSLPDIRISLDHFPSDQVVIEAAKLFARGGRSSWNHLDASDDNIQALCRAGIDKLVLQVRDPRQAMLSFIHHVDRNLVAQNLHYRARLDPHIPSAWAEWSLGEKIDFYIDGWLPKAMSWMERWCQVIADQCGPEILVLRFEDMREDALGHMKQIAAFYGYSTEQLSVSEKDANPHFRSGLKEEWREVLSPLQQRQANKHISFVVMETLGYPGVKELN